MDHDFKERMDRARAAERRSNARSQLTRAQTMPVSLWGVHRGVTVRNPRPRLRGMKRRQRLMVRRLLITRLERMAAKGIVPDVMPVIP